MLFSFNQEGSVVAYILTHAVFVSVFFAYPKGFPLNSKCKICSNSCSLFEAEVKLLCSFKVVTALSPIPYRHSWVKTENLASPAFDLLVTRKSSSF